MEIFITNLKTIFCALLNALEIEGSKSLLHLTSNLCPSFLLERGKYKQAMRLYRHVCARKHAYTHVNVCTSKRSTGRERENNIAKERFF